MWVVKPVSLNRGEGIEVVSKMREVYDLIIKT